MSATVVHVAAGILLHPDGRFLMTSRPTGKAYAGYWEFPGGKIEAGETPLAALTRELNEELGIQITQANPWIVQTFAYPHATVRLYFFKVTDWLGILQPREGQLLDWQYPKALSISPILPANGPILRGLIQPEIIAFSNVAELGIEQFLNRLETQLAKKPMRLILREPQLDANKYTLLAQHAQKLVQQHGSTLILHQHIQLAYDLQADGIHLPGRSLSQLNKRPQGLDWVGASTHNAEELERAVHLGLDYAVLGHVACTLSHPNVEPLGWDKFSRIMAQGWSIPIFAIGGMQLSDAKQAQQYGAHGIAMLRAFWEIDGDSQ